MPTVLHVGPALSKGGMGAVIQTLAANPPEGWDAEVLATHADGGAIAVGRAWLRGRKALRKRLRRGGIDVVHVHTAADWSWWRKRRVIEICRARDLPVILHIHAGNFDAFCKEKGAEIAAAISRGGVLPVTLTPTWQTRLQPWLGRSQVVANPAPQPDPVPSSKRDRMAFALVGRAKPVKNHRMAIEVVNQLRLTGHDITLHLLGVAPDDPIMAAADEGIIAHGWLTGEAKAAVLDGCGTLLSPSFWEGQSMAVLEAMAKGMPVLASEASADLFVEAGHVLPDLRPKVWIRYIHSLLSNPEVWGKMADAGPVEVEKFTLARARVRWGELYARAIQQESEGQP